MLGRQVAKALKSMRKFLPKASHHSISSAATYTKKTGLKIATNVRGSQSVRNFHLASQSATGMSHMLLNCRSGLELRANSIRDVWQEFPCAIHRYVMDLSNYLLLRF